MDLIVTLPESERRAPPSFRRRGESYWASAELPLDTEWVFVVNTIEDRQRSLPSRSILTVTTPQFLDVLARVGSEAISCVYLVRRVVQDGSDSLSINRLSSVRAGEDKENGWAKVLIFETVEGPAFVSEAHLETARQLVNEVEIARFPANASCGRVAAKPSA